MDQVSYQETRDNRSLYLAICLKSAKEPHLTALDELPQSLAVKLRKRKIVHITFQQTVRFCLQTAAFLYKYLSFTTRFCNTKLFKMKCTFIERKFHKDDHTICSTATDDDNENNNKTEQDDSTDDSNDDHLGLCQVCFRSLS